MSRDRISALKARLSTLGVENRALQEVNQDASGKLTSIGNQHEALLELNRRLSIVNAQAAELLAEVDEKNKTLDKTNREIARANAEAAELVAEIELKNHKIETLNRALSTANVNSAEMLVEIDEKNRLLNKTNRKLARANAEAAELMAEVELKNEQIEALNQTLTKQNGEIELLSVTDHLTQAFNRNYLDKQLPSEIKRIRRYRHSLSVILCDIDHFKKVNDRYGHRVGDLVLKDFSACLKKAVRDEVDWLVRLGGEEFLIVLPETDLKGAITTAERIRKLVSERRIRIDEESITVTASFGVSCYVHSEKNGNPMTMERLIENADRCLYQAKRRGRNKVVGEDA